jgi:flagellar hook-associated protein 1 FlgK
MSSSLMQVALSGIAAAQAGLTTTGQNISNANTVGFSRQSLVQSAAMPAFSGSGYIGAGTSVETVKRAYSASLSAQVQAAESQHARAVAYADGMSQLNSLVGDPDRSASQAISDFMATAHQVTVNPADVASRQSMMASAETMVQRFNAIAGGMRDLQKQANHDLGLALRDINGQASQIAALNNSIAGQAASGRTPNDLLDQRDQAIAQLNRSVRATAVYQEDGTASIYLGNGQALVTGGIAQSLGLALNDLDPERPSVAMHSGIALIPLAGDSDLGGEVGGLIQFRDHSLAEAQGAIGRLARVMAETVNARNRLGQDVNGGAGGDLLNAGPIPVSVSSINQGSASLAAAVSSATQLAASDYRVVFDRGGYTATRLSDNSQTRFDSLPAQLDGLQLSLSGTPSEGDSFLVASASGAALAMTMASRDPARIATGLPVAVSTGAANKGDATASLVVSAAVATLRDSATLRFDGAGQVTITTAKGAQTLPWKAGEAIAFNGWELSLNGTPRAGDTFTVGANVNAPGDNRNVAAIAALGDEGLVDGITYTGAYGQLVASLGVEGREAELMKTATESLAKNAEQSRDSIAGVNLDEEAMNMLRYQQAYQAAGKMLSVANTLFDTILQVSR